MKQSFLVLRAVATELAKRIYTPVVITLSIIAVILVLLVVWLVTISTWWLLLAVPVLILVIVCAAFLVLAGTIISTVTPTMTKAQRGEVKSFVDSIQELSEITQTPKVMLLYRVIKDAVSPRKTAYIESVIAGASGLKRQYQSLASSFSEELS
jgi:hypothetical protein